MKLLILVFVFGSFSLVDLRAQTLTTVYSRSANQFGNFFGSALDVTDKWVAIGEPGNDDNGADVGAVQVLSASTRAYIKTLYPEAPAPSEGFGRALALSGNMLAVNGRSGIYLYELPTGKLLRLIPPPSGQEFRATVGLDGQRVITGYSSNSLPATTALVYDVRTGASLGGFTSAVTAAYLNVAISGRRAVMGLRGNGQATGGVVVFEADSGAVVRNFFDPSTNYNEYGSALAISGKRLLVTNNGRRATDLGPHTNAYLAVYDMDTGANHFTISGTDFNFALFYTNFADYVDIQGDQIAYRDYSSGTGVIHLLDIGNPNYLTRRTFSPGFAVALADTSFIMATYRPGPLTTLEAVDIYSNSYYAVPMRVLDRARLGSLMPGTPGASLTKIRGFTASTDGDAFLSGTLGGAGVKSTNDDALWIGAALGATQMVRREGTLLGATGATVTALGEPLANSTGAAFAPMTLIGGAVPTGANNKFVHLQTDTPTLGTTGNDGLLFFKGIRQVVNTSVSASASYPIAGMFDRKVIPNLTSTTNDSALIVYSPSGTATQIVVESTTSPAGPLHGQLSPRLSYGGTAVAFSCALTGAATSVADNHALFILDGTAGEALVWRKGGPVGTTSLKFGTCLGESSGPLWVNYRATVTGPGINVANNEVIGSSYTGIEEIAAQKGNQANGLPSGQRWRRFSRWWGASLTFDPKAVFIFGHVAGTGVTPVNDGIIWQSNGATNGHIILREGDHAPGCDDGARIGSILSVQSNAQGDQAVALVSLVNCPAHKNQAIYHLRPGYSTLLMPPLTPSLILRKGAITYQVAGSPPITLTGIAFGSSTSTVDATGALSKGLPTCVSSSNVALILSWSDKSVRAATAGLQ